MSTKRERQEANAQRSREIFYARETAVRKQQELFAERQIDEAVDQGREYARDLKYLRTIDPDDPRIAAVEKSWEEYRKPLPPKARLAAINAFRDEFNS
jgi:hypothetical protein